MWVRSEYAGELAVLSAWVCALLPWSVTYAGRIPLIRVHFLFAYFQFAPGSGLGDLLDTTVLATDAAGVADNQSVTFGYELWLAGVALLGVALALSVVYYLFDDRLEARSPVDPVRVMGGLLVAAAVPLTAATYLVHAGGLGVTFPVGVPFMFLLGGLLLVVERAEGVDVGEEAAVDDEVAYDDELGADDENVTDDAPATSTPEDDVND